MDLFTIIGVLAVALIILALVESEKEFGAGLIAILAVVYGAWNFGFVTSFNWVMSHLLTILAYAAFYLAAGVGWSFFKWDRLVAKWVKDNAKEGLPDWRDFTDRLASWTIWWPFSMIGYLVGTFIRDVVRWVQTQVGKVYDKITARHAKQ